MNQIEIFGTVKRENYKRLIEIAQHWEYGTLHNHEEISSILGVQYNPGSQNKVYYREVYKANRELSRIGKMIRVNRNEGYEVVTPEQYAECARKDAKTSGKWLTKALKKINNCPTELLTSSQKTELVMTGDYIQGLRSFYKKERRDFTQMLKEQTRLNIRTGRN